MCQLVAARDDLNFLNGTDCFVDRDVEMLRGSDDTRHICENGSLQCCLLSGTEIV